MGSDRGQGNSATVSPEEHSRIICSIGMTLGPTPVGSKGHTPHHEMSMGPDKGDLSILKVIFD